MKTYILASVGFISLEQAVLLANFAAFFTFPIAETETKTRNEYQKKCCGIEKTGVKFMDETRSCSFWRFIFACTVGKISSKNFKISNHSSSVLHHFLTLSLYLAYLYSINV